MLISWSRALLAYYVIYVLGELWTEKLRKDKNVYSVNMNATVGFFKHFGCYWIVGGILCSDCDQWTNNNKMEHNLIRGVNGTVNSDYVMNTHDYILVHNHFEKKTKTTWFIILQG